MGVEIEVKLVGTARAHGEIREAYPLQYHKTEMETTYYDTPEGTLSQRKITLRRRMENGVPVCTVKTPLADMGRGEWECGAADIDRGILELCKLGAPKELLLLTEAGVVPVCGARFTRYWATLDVDGTRLELALDSGVLTGGGKEIPLCEVEVELKSGDAAVAAAFAQSLAHRFGLKQEERSKFRRALALAEGE